jgi:tripartite-type tricarboxylate transporter receptor subunit TctC
MCRPLLSGVASIKSRPVVCAAGWGAQFTTFSGKRPRPFFGQQSAIRRGACGGQFFERIRERARDLAVTTATRSDALPDVPTVSEFVPGYEASAWFGVGAPKNTPSQIIDKLNEAINAGLADPKIKARLADLGGTPLVGSPTDFGKLIADETEKWGKVIRAANINAE